MSFSESSPSSLFLPKVARQSTRLDFVSDPADEIIAATSLVEQIPLLTRDGRMLESRMIPLARTSR